MGLIIQVDGVRRPFMGDTFHRITVLSMKHHYTTWKMHCETHFSVYAQSVATMTSFDRATRAIPHQPTHNLKFLLHIPASHLYPRPGALSQCMHFRIASAGRHAYGRRTAPPTRVLLVVPAVSAQLCTCRAPAHTTSPILHRE